MEKTKVKIVVLDEHTFGYVYEDTPHNMSILRASILRGSYYSELSGPISISGMEDRIRLATREDFDVYRIHFSDSYLEDKIYEYIWNKEGFLVS